MNEVDVGAGELPGGGEVRLPESGCDSSSHSHVFVRLLAEKGCGHGSE